jgi:hypothetical protein
MEHGQDSLCRACQARVEARAAAKRGLTLLVDETPAPAPFADLRAKLQADAPAIAPAEASGYAALKAAASAQLAAASAAHRERAQALLPVTNRAERA